VALTGCPAPTIFQTTKDYDMTLRATLRPAGKGESYAICEGIEVRHGAPVLALCRALVAAGFDPGEPLEAYRGDMLCLKVRTIGEGARLVVNGKGTGFQLEGATGGLMASPVRLNAPAEWLAE
jgi:hypothetical protein